LCARLPQSEPLSRARPCSAPPPTRSGPGSCRRPGSTSPVPVPPRRPGCVSTLALCAAARFRPPAKRFPVFAGHTLARRTSLRCRARTNLSSPTHPQRSFVSSPIAREEDEYEIDEHAVRLIPLVPNPPSVARLPTAPYTTDRAPPRCVREALRQSPTTDATLVVRFRFRLRI
jgi:hypothetical protein